MNVLHIGNTAAIPKDLRDHLRAHGIGSDIVTFYPDVLKQGTDFEHPYPKWIRSNPPLYSAFRMGHMLKMVRNYDVLHFHAFGGITFYLDYPLWNLLKKHIILHYHGTDLRRMHRILGRESPFARYADKRYVSTPDLLPLAPGATWLPSPLPVSAFPYVGVEEKDPDEPLIVLNAVASEEHGLAYKGLGVIREAMRKVQAAGYSVEFRSLVGVPYAEALQQYQQADIIIGQTHIGWYGKFEEECMAFGKPVVTYVNPDTEAALNLVGIGGDRGVPVGHIRQDDADSLVHRLAFLIENPDERVRLAREGRAFVEEWHDAPKVMAGLEQDYAEITGDV